MADEAFDGTQAEGKYTPKDAYDSMEMALNLAILDSGDFFAGAGAARPAGRGICAEFH